MSTVCYCGRPECPVVESIHPDKCHAFEVERLRADNARLRSNLEWCESNLTRRAFARGAGLPMIRATLASTDAAQWLRERERRVAERVATALGLVPEPMTGGRIYAPHMVTDQGKAARDILDSLLKEET